MALVGRVGADQVGIELRDSVQAAGVDVSGVRIAEAAVTGIALILVDPNGDNMISILPGANAQAAPTDLDGALDGVQALLLQLEIPVEACLAAADAARAAGVPVVLNAAPLPHVRGPELSALIGRVDVLIVNETEAAGLVPETVSPAEALRDLGVPEVVVTLGEGGAVAADASGATHVPTFPVHAVDAVGAGDAFCAEYVLARTAGGIDLLSATRSACAAGALAASRRGAQVSFPTRDEVDRLVAGANSEVRHAT